MNIKYLLSLFAAGAFLFASCTEENEINGNTPIDGSSTDDTSGRKEVLLNIKNSLVLQKTGTKAAEEPIATEEENYIRTLDVYVFGAKKENDPYTLQEIHYYRDDASTVTLPGVDTYSFNLNSDADDSAITTGLLKLKKGLFVKLYCIANRTELYATSDEGTTNKFAGFKSLIQTAPGQDDNQVTTGTPSEADFKKLHIKLIDPLAATPTEDDILNSPLPMSGAYITPLDLTDFGSSARTQISLKLSRMVARFDIVNDASKSKFTLEKISMGNGQKGTKFFPIETVGKTADDLISYPEREVLADTQQTPDETTGVTDLTKGAFYSYPSPKDDHGYLMLKGKYAVNKTENKEVSYQIPFQQMVNGIGTYIEVSHNHRYTITITKADTYHLDVDLKVAEWDDKEVVDPYEPENDFDRMANVVLEAALSQDAYVLDNGQVSVLPQDNSKFAFKIGSNTALEHTVIYKSEGAVKWLVKDGEPAVSKASSQETTYKFKVDKSALDAAAGQKLEEVTIRLINPASGSRKDIKVIPTQGPAVTFVNQADNYNVFNVAKQTAYIYNLADQNIKLNVASETRLKDPSDESQGTVTGSTVTVTAGNTGMSASSDVTDEEGEYTLTVDGTGTNGEESSVDFTSVASKAKTTIKVILKDPEIAPLTTGNFKSERADNTFTLNGGTGSIPQVSLVGVANNSFTLAVISPEGVEITSTDDSKKWLSVNDYTIENKGQKVTTITGTITDATGMLATGKTDGEFTIKNKLDPTKTIKVEVVTSVPVAATVSKSVNDTGLNALSSKEVTLYNAEGQSILLSTDILATLEAKSDAGFLRLSNGTNSEHKITLPTAQSLPLSATPKLVFTTGDGATTEITVALKSPAITALTTSDIQSTTGTNILTEATDASNTKVTITDATPKSKFTLSVKSQAGITIGETSSWLKVAAAPATGTPGDYTTVVTVSIVGGTNLTEAITNGKIVLTNNIPNGGDMTIDVETSVPTAIP